jgi:magnesium-transporting ATPase (P-type)
MAAKEKSAGSNMYVNFSAQLDMHKALWRSDEVNRADKTKMFLTHMAISNTITPVIQNKQTPDAGKEREFYDSSPVVFQSSSPDELALCSFAEYMGFKLVKRNPTTLFVKDPLSGKTYLEEYAMIASLDFNSKRKRVTLIYRDLTDESDDPRVFVMTKGADSVLWPLISGCSPEEEASLNDGLEDMSKNGLRTLLLAHSTKTVSWWNKWASSWAETSTLSEKGNEANHTKGGCADQCRICYAMEMIERDAGLGLLGATAIEDRLQDLVPESIEDFLAGGIKVWMLTGDKRETAKNIALACNLIDPDMENVEADYIVFKDLGYNAKDTPESENRLIEITGRVASLVARRDVLATIFSTWDDDGDGFIAVEDLKALLSLMKVNSKLNGDLVERIKQRIDFPSFVDLLETMKITFAESVYVEIEEGLKAAEKITFTHNPLPISMVIEGAALSVLYAPDSDATIYRDKFFELASMCKSVVACRLTPHQKATIVREVKERKKALCLAVGDGANDEQMIKEANVGIGIAGLEGSAASRASDYAIGKFRFLHSLLFVHGTWNYSRVAAMTHYIFYKTTIHSMASFCFGFLSMFSGQQYFNDLLAQLYNPMMTAAPVAILAALDRRLPRNVLENNPTSYGSITKGKLFNKLTFSSWIGAAMLQAFFIVLITMGSFGTTDITHHDGKAAGLWYISTSGYISVCLTATFQIFFEMYSITIAHQVVVWGSFLLIWITMAIVGNLPQNPTAEPLFGVTQRMFATPRFWFTIILSVSTALLLTYAVKAYYAAFRPSTMQQMGESRLVRRRKAAEARALARKSKITPTLPPTTKPAHPGQPSVHLTPAKPEVHIVPPELLEFGVRKSRANTSAMMRNNSRRATALTRSYNRIYNPTGGVLDGAAGAAATLELDQGVVTTFHGKSINLKPGRASSVDDIDVDSVSDEKDFAYPVAVRAASSSVVNLPRKPRGSLAPPVLKAVDEF